MSQHFFTVRRRPEGGDRSPGCGRGDSCGGRHQCGGWRGAGGRRAGRPGSCGAAATRACVTEQGGPGVRCCLDRCRDRDIRWLCLLQVCAALPLATLACVYAVRCVGHLAGRIWSTYCILGVEAAFFFPALERTSFFALILCLTPATLLASCAMQCSTYCRYRAAHASTHLAKVYEWMNERRVSSRVG